MAEQARQIGKVRTQYPSQKVGMCFQGLLLEHPDAASHI
jgi:hypothetical protein